MRHAGIRTGTRTRSRAVGIGATASRPRAGWNEADGLGFEHIAQFPGKTAIDGQCGAKSGALGE